MAVPDVKCVSAFWIVQNLTCLTMNCLQLGKLALAEDRPHLLPLRNAVPDGNPTVRFELSLGVPFHARLCGENIILTMDKENSGSPELVSLQ